VANVSNSGSSEPAPPPPPSAWQERPATTAISGYGGFWVRVAAYLIDSIVILVIGVLIGGVYGFMVGFTGGTEAMAISGGYVIGFVVTWLYFALMESSERGATFGKRAMGLRVVTDQGQRLTFGHATGRFFAKLVSALVLGIGFLMVAFTERKRGLHDMMAGTLVVTTA
jgi:uncharacterized RDD family membrane protein YckC